MRLNRRSALMLGMLTTAGWPLLSASAQTYPRKDRRIDPVLFWNEVSLDLVALDHSIDLVDARSPGPCASARALGVVHCIIADAVCFAYRTDYKPQFYRGGLDFKIDVPELFVGGAAAGILTRIFSTSMHAYTIGVKSERFRRLLASETGKDWQAGIAFANSAHFGKLWTWDKIQRLLLPQFSAYVPRPRQHNIDPYNAGQGFYGTDWGSYHPLVLDGPRRVAALEPEAPPHEGSPEYEHDLAEVRVKGALQSKADQHFAARTPRETNIGLFWAYDGARLLGTPPRFFNQIIRQIAISDDLNVAETARLFALCNLAIADASIVAWSAKYRYNVWRPVLGIQNHARLPVPDWLPLGSPKTNPVRVKQRLPIHLRETAQSLMGGGLSVLPYQFSQDEEFRDSKHKQNTPQLLYRDAVFTPNFPSYPSGHATFGGACFTMLKLLRRERPQTHRKSRCYPCRARVGRVEWRVFRPLQRQRTAVLSDALWKYRSHDC